MPAGRDEGHDDVIADLEPTRAGTDCLDDTGPLVAAMTGRFVGRSFLTQ